jgi:hypothetical protein
MTHPRTFGLDLRLVFAALLVSLLVFTGPAAALPVLDFDFATGSAGPGGTIATSGGHATGTGILIDTMTYTYEFASPTSQVFDLTGAGIGLAGTTAVLNFSTGGAGGNFIEIIGGVPDLSIANGTTLLSGFFTDFSISTGGTFGMVNGGGHGLNSNALLTALGLPNDLNFDFFGFTIGLAIPGQGGPYTARSTDIVTTVPGPSMLVMLGVGLLAVTALVRRRTN